jgi:cell division protein FtsI (penicillin-binding protein 3)
LTTGIVVATCAESHFVACVNPRADTNSAANSADSNQSRADGANPASIASGSSAKSAPASNGALPAASTTRHAIAAEVASALHVAPARLAITIDDAIQRIVDEEIAALTAAHSPTAATAVVLGVAKSEVLALGDSVTARRAIVTGSTLKPMTAAAAFETGAVRSDQKFDCHTRTYGAHRLSDDKERATLDIAQILEVSSNVGASRIFDAMGATRFDEILARFHLADATRELPNVERGAIPKTVSLGAYEAAMVAAGEALSVTPIQMAAGYAVFARGGEYIAPTLVRAIEEGASRSPGTGREQVIRPETARTVMQWLERAVQGRDATGKAAQIEGVRVAGKTGTGGYSTSDGKEHIYASFVGIVPADAPRYVILVGAVDPRGATTGGVVAAPTFAKIASRALGAR